MNKTNHMLCGFGIAACCAGCAAGSGEGEMEDAWKAPVTLYVASAAEDGGILRATYDPATNGWQTRRMLDCPGVNYLAYDASGRRGLFSRGGEQGGVGWWLDYNVGPASSGGAECCHLIAGPDGNFVYAANYSGGNFAEFPVVKGFLGRARIIATPPPECPDSDRQEASHPHQCQFTPDGKFLAVVDLGSDAVLCYPYDATRGVADVPAAVNRLHSGAGPRHLVFSPDGTRAYVANELDSTVSEMTYGDGVLSEERQISIRDRASQAPVGYPAAIRITRDGRWLLVSNRGDNTIAVIALDAAGDMAEPKFFACGGDWPRDFAFSPDECRVAVANEKSGNVRIFRWDGATGTLTPETAELAVPQAQSILF